MSVSRFLFILKLRLAEHVSLYKRTEDIGLLFSGSRLMRKETSRHILMNDDCHEDEDNDSLNRLLVLFFFRIRRMSYVFFFKKKEVSRTIEKGERERKRRKKQLFLVT